MAYAMTDVQYYKVHTDVVQCVISSKLVITLIGVTLLKLIFYVNAIITFHGSLLM